MGMRMQEIRLRKRIIGVEMQGISVGMWGMQGIRVEIWEIGVGMQRIKLEMQSNWGKNKDALMEIRHRRSGEGCHKKCICLQLNFMQKFFHKSCSFTFLAKDLFSEIYGFNAHYCKIHIPKLVCFCKIYHQFQLVLDHERCALSNAVVFFTKL